MSYVNDNLMPNEKVLFSARIHPAIFLPAIGSFVFTVIVVLFGSSSMGKSLLAGSQQANGSGVLLCISGVLLLYTISSALQALVVILTTEFAVTNRRVIAKAGFIRRHTLEMLLSKVESVAVHQDINGRVMNYGTVVVTGTGGTKESFKAIKAPLAVRQTINQIIEENTQAFTPERRAAEAMG
jgi:uncharacterized membrane protein YdbT with pleckstrin-like domain